MSREPPGRMNSLERAQLLVPTVDGLLQALDLAFLQRLVVGHRQLAAKIEQAVLARAEHADQLIERRPLHLRIGQLGKQQAELAVERIDLAHGLDAG